MKTVFDLIKEICASKKPYTLEADDQFSPFVVQRGLSMISPQALDLLNGTTNILYKGLDDQQMMDLLKMLVPRSVGYHKWITKTDKEDPVKKAKRVNKIKEVAQLLERSEKSIKMMIKLDPDFLSQFEEEKSSIRKKS